MRIWQELILAYIGGMLYVALELLWRGWSHPSMFFLGGLCFVLIGALGRVPAIAGSPLLGRAILGAAVITTLELIFGLVLNVALELHVWDYSGLPFHFKGQICLYFFLLWIPVAAAAIVANDCLRYLLFRTPIPEYRLF